MRGASSSGSWSVCAEEPAAPVRKFSGRSMRRIRAGFGAQRPGSERYSHWGPWESWRGKLGERGEEGQGREERTLTWNCQEADGGPARLGRAEQPWSHLTSRLVLQLPQTNTTVTLMSCDCAFNHYKRGRHRRSRRRLFPHTPPLNLLRAKREVVLYGDECRTKGCLRLRVCLWSSWLVSQSASSPLSPG